MKNRWAALSMLSGSVLFGLPLLAAAQGTHSGAAGLEAVLAESAETPAQHRALADHYTARAAEARSQADVHRSMAKHYGGTLKATVADQQKAHCKTLATSFDEQAKAYDALASAHADAAAGE
jgi:hypothetical protein